MTILTLVDHDLRRVVEAATGSPLPDERSQDFFASLDELEARYPVLYALVMATFRHSGGPPVASPDQDKVRPLRWISRLWRRPVLAGQPVLDSRRVWAAALVCGAGVMAPATLQAVTSWGVGTTMAMRPPANVQTPVASAPSVARPVLAKPRVAPPVTRTVTRPLPPPPVPTVTVEAASVKAAAPVERGRTAQSSSKRSEDSSPPVQRSPVQRPVSRFTPLVRTVPAIPAGSGQTDRVEPDRPRSVVVAAPSPAPASGRPAVSGARASGTRTAAPAVVSGAAAAPAPTPTRPSTPRPSASPVAVAVRPSPTAVPSASPVTSTPPASLVAFESGATRGQSTMQTTGQLTPSDAGLEAGSDGELSSFSTPPAAGQVP